MKYHVQLGAESVDVDIDGETATVAGDAVTARISQVQGTPVHVLTLGDEVHRVIARRGATKGTHTLWVDGYRFDVEALDERARVIRELSAASQQAAGPAPLIAPMPGMIVRVAVSVGDVVSAGQGLVVMEAMKMENELHAASAGVVKVIHAVAGTAVEKGAVLLELE